MIAGSGLNERYGLNELPVYKNRLRHGADVQIAHRFLNC